MGTVATGQAHRCFVQAGAGGLIDGRWCTAAYADVLRALPADLSEADVTRPELLLYDDGTLSVYFTPFDWVNLAARVAIVGLTPGRQQMYLAVKAAGDALRAGCGIDDALVRADAQASFAGAMRTNLIQMLDGVGLHAALGMRSSAQLFDDRADLVSTTSAICHAAFRHGGNYSGYPPVGRHPLLAAFARQVLAANLAMLPDALVIPLGREASQAVALAGADPNRVLAAFPHPSGANGHRKRLYTAARDDMATTVVAWFTRPRTAPAVT